MDTANDSLEPDKWQAWNKNKQYQLDVFTFAVRHITHTFKKIGVLRRAT